MTSSSQDNETLLQQLKTGFKRTINWNEYRLETRLQTQNRHLNHLIDPGFQGVNRVFVLSFENHYKQYFLLTLEVKEYNVLIGGNFFLIRQ